MLAAVRCASQWCKQHLQQIKDHSNAEIERKASEKRKLSEIKELEEKRKRLSLEVLIVIQVLNGATVESRILKKRVKNKNDEKWRLGVIIRVDGGHTLQIAMRNNLKTEILFLNNR